MNKTILTFSHINNFNKIIDIYTSINVYYMELYLRNKTQLTGVNSILESILYEY